MTLQLPNEIVNDTPADAVPIDSNYKAIEQYVNTNSIHRNGSIGMIAQLTLVGDPVSDNHAVRKAYVDAVLPVGIMLPWLGITAPAGQWGLANGAVLQTTTWPDLFNVLGYRYGGSAGSFNLPNMAGAVPIAVDSAQTRFDTTGKKGGSFVVPVPQHLHTINHDHGSLSTGAGGVTHTHTINHDHGNVATTTGAGGQHSHNISARNTTSGQTQSAVGATSTGTTYTIGTADSVEHTHAVSVNLPTYSGSSGAASAYSHTHTVDLPSFSGSSANTGTAGAELVPVFVVINYIVRIA